MIPACSAILSSPRKSASTPIRPSAISAAVLAKSSAAAAMALSLTKYTGWNTTPVSPAIRPCSSSSRDLETRAMVASGSGYAEPAANRSCTPSSVRRSVAG